MLTEHRRRGSPHAGKILPGRKDDVLIGEMWRRIRERLSPGGTPSLPELYPGEKDVESVEVAHEAGTTSLVDPDADTDDDFLDSGRITLEQRQAGADDIDDRAT